ncbi:junctional adhesion molecule 2A isoform 2-T3 [Anableps anableps]
MLTAQFPGFPSAPVTVSTNKHKVEVEEFSDVELSCLFHTERDPNPRIEWKKKAKEVSFVYFDRRFRGPFEGRATINGATVTLHRVTQEDAGEYRCEISASLDAVSLGETNVTLNVLVPPQTPTCEVPTSAVTGSVVQLRCQDQQSVPPATYFWFKDNKPISQLRHANATYLINSHTGILEFQAVTKEDSGRYSCLATNGVGSPKMCEGKHMTIESNMTLTLFSPPGGDRSIIRTQREVLLDLPVSRCRPHQQPNPSQNRRHVQRQLRPPTPRAPGFQTHTIIHALRKWLSVDGQ